MAKPALKLIPAKPALKLIPEHKLTCSNCLAYEADQKEKNIGVCKRTLHSYIDAEGDFISYFPPISPDQWCLQHRVRCDA